MVDKTDVICTNAPEAVGPYSQAIKTGDLLFMSGQLPLDPASGELDAPDVEGQARRVLENMTRILECVGAGTGNVVRTTVFLVNLHDFELVNEIYAEFFPFCPPARTTVEVSNLPKGAMVCMDAIASLA